MKIWERATGIDRDRSEASAETCRSSDSIPRPSPLRRHPSQHHVLNALEMVTCFKTRNPNLPIHFDALHVSTTFSSTRRSNYVLISDIKRDPYEYTVLNAHCTYNDRKRSTQVRWIGLGSRAEVRRWLSTSKVAFLFREGVIIPQLCNDHRKRAIQAALRDAHSHTNREYGMLADRICQYVCTPTRIYEMRGALGGRAEASLFLCVAPAHRYSDILLPRFTERYFHHVEDMSDNVNTIE